MAVPLETYLGRALLALAIVLVLWVGVRLAVDTPNYGPGNEAYQVASPSRSPSTACRPCSERTRSRSIRGARCHRGPSRSGTSSHPTGGRRRVPRRPATRSCSPSSAPSPTTSLAPVSWVVPWHHRLLVLRLLCVGSCALGRLPLGRGARGVAREPARGGRGRHRARDDGRPRQRVRRVPARGVAARAVVRGHVARAARLPAADAAVGGPSRSWTAATCVSSVAVPAAVASIVYTSRALGARRVAHADCSRASRSCSLRRSRGSCGTSTPTAIPWPLNVVAGGLRSASRLAGADAGAHADLRRQHEHLRRASTTQGSHRSHGSTSDPRASSPSAVAVALVMALLTGRIAFARLALARVRSAAARVVPVDLPHALPVLGRRRSSGRLRSAATSAATRPPGPASRASGSRRRSAGVAGSRRRPSAR